MCWGGGLEKYVRRLKQISILEGIANLLAPSLKSACVKVVYLYLVKF